MGPEDGNLAIWVGTLVPNESTYLVVSASGKDGETLQRMARIGYTKVHVRDRNVHRPDTLWMVWTLLEIQYLKQARLMHFSVHSI